MTYFMGTSLAMITAIAAAPMMIMVPRSGCRMIRTPTTPRVAITGTMKCPKVVSSFAFFSKR